jgi:tRNA U34 5-methylaminomethyl-2-thiouridine-forming methyltransferase MnmC
MNEVTVIVTEDGSSSLIQNEINETYHSVHGALQESKHVFINSGLTPALQANIKEISILEIGFGTGLNALLTFIATQQSTTQIYYETIEAYPLTKTTVAQLNYPFILNIASPFTAIHECDWNVLCNISARFLLHKRAIKIEVASLAVKKFDLVYFDAFAPSKQPEMWTLSILEKVVNAMKPQGIFVTYSSKGQLKRDLSTLGLLVEKLSGPPGKREMIRAIKN